MEFRASFLVSVEGRRRQQCDAVNIASSTRARCSNGVDIGEQKRTRIALREMVPHKGKGWREQGIWDSSTVGVGMTGHSPFVLTLDLAPPKVHVVAMICAGPCSLFALDGTTRAASISGASARDWQDWRFWACRGPMVVLDFCSPNHI